MDKKSYNLAVYISGKGSNFRAIYENTVNGFLNSKIKLLFSSNNKTEGFFFGKEKQIPTYYLDRKIFLNREDFKNFQFNLLNRHNIDYILLCGYLKKINPEIIKKYENRILNIHPALLPKFGGKGMYGINVHRAVIEQNEQISGATIHFVNEKYDEGQIFMQKKIDLSNDETPESLQSKVLLLEHRLFSEAIRKLELK